MEHQLTAPEPLATSVDAALDANRCDPTRLLQILIDTQARLDWLPPAALTRIAAALELSRARVVGVAGFYSFLYRRPVGAYRLLFADNIIEQMAGGRELMASLAAKLGSEPGRVTSDGLASVDFTSCIGMSDQAPSLLINGRVIPSLTPARIDHIAALIAGRAPLADWPDELFAITDNVRRSDALLDSRLQPGEALKRAVALGPDALIKEVKTSRLRGRGGAGFATAQKWGFCRSAPLAPGATRVVVCNADEGEPGTFKDRVLLTRYADQVFEGMTLAAFAIGAKRGFLYLRGEYLYLRGQLEQTLARRRAAGLLGKAILGQRGFDFDIEIHLGAGAYVCGEETALIESLEGKRGTPRIRPPFPVTNGYLQQPTVVNNVETLASVTLIAARGGEAFAAVGAANSTGTKLISVSGDCALPGVYEYPFGVTIADILADSGARETQAVQFGGAAGLTLAPHEFSRHVAFEDAPTAGAMMIFDKSRDMFEVARNFAHFFAHESCGFCTPCRIGTAMLRDSLDKLAAGRGATPDLREIERLDRLLRNTSHCGLGQAAANPVLEGLHKFRPAYAERAQRSDFQPAFSLDASLAPARAVTGRDDALAHFEDEAR